jgi:hypothetical protein
MMTICAIAVSVVLQINNVVGAPRVNLEQAQQEVTRLYRRIGVDVAWTSPDAPQAAALRAIRVVLLPDEGGDLRHRQTPVMGAAVVTDQGTRIAYVFYRQIESQARQYDVSATMILASAIAHEVAHLLLPDGQHSAGGLMRACWTRDDFHRAEQGQLLFSTEQAALIRERVAGKLMTLDFPQEDREQFAQLMGYSISGYHELSYVSDESCAQASVLAEQVEPGSGGCRDAGCGVHGGPLFDEEGRPLT